MSSVVAFLRALVMVACLVAVPVLTVSYGGAVSRGLQATARFLERISTDQPADVPARVGALRTARPAPAAAVGGKSSAAHPTQDVAPLLPEPLEDRGASPSAPVAAERRMMDAAANEPGAPFPSPVPLPPHPPAAVAAWQQKAAQLQQLGAVEYALETWGDSGDLYRFRCLAAVPGAASYQKHFHAVDSDGGRAVETVLEQVRVWRDRTSGAN